MKRAIALLIFAFSQWAALAQTKVDYITQLKNQPNITSDNNAAFGTLALACNAASTGVLLVTRVWTSVPTQSLGCDMWFVGAGKLIVATGATVTVTGNVTCDVFANCFDITTNAGAGVTFSTPPSAMLSRITAAPSSDLILRGGSSGAGITIEDNNPGRIQLNPLQPVDASFTDMIYGQGTVTGAFLADTFLGRFSLVANNATIGFHSAALLGEFRTTGTTSATQYTAGMYGYVNHLSSGLLSQADSVIGVLKTQGTGNITEATGFRTEMSQAASTGRMVTVRNFYATGLTNPAGAAIPTNLVGFWAADMGVDGGLATNVYAFLSLGDTKSLLSGPLQLGSKLRVHDTTVSEGTVNSTINDTGTVDTNGTSVTAVPASGAVFSPAWGSNIPPYYININGLNYQIASVADTTHMTLASSAGVSSGQSYAVITGADLRTNGGLTVQRDVAISGLLKFPTVGTTCVTGVVFNNTTSTCIFGAGAGNIRLNAAKFFTSADVVPTTAGTQDFGETGARWRNGWFGNVTATNFTGAYNSSDASAGITTVKVAGACTFTVKDGIITGIAGC